MGCVSIKVKLVMCMDIFTPIMGIVFFPAGKSARIYLLVLCFGGSRGQKAGKKKDGAGKKRAKKKDL